MAAVRHALSALLLLLVLPLVAADGNPLYRAVGVAPLHEGHVLTTHADGSVTRCEYPRMLIESGRADAGRYWLRATLAGSSSPSCADVSTQGMLPSDGWRWTAQRAGGYIVALPDSGCVDEDVIGLAASTYPDAGVRPLVAPTMVFGRVWLDTCTGARTEVLAIGQAVFHTAASALPNV